MRYFSNSDKREMKRIARMRTDREVFICQRRAWKREYYDMWRKWLETKGANYSTIFVDDERLNEEVDF